MTDRTAFTLDGREISAAPGETLWEVAKREGNCLPHLCHADAPGYRADGNCRACVVEIAGERVLAASCIRKPLPGMVVTTGSERAVKARRMVTELLLADQPPRVDAHDRSSQLWKMADLQDLDSSRFPPRPAGHVPLLDDSHVAMRVNLDACIHCNLCVRACREVQVNDVIGMAGRGLGERIVFDMADPMGGSTCVACGECVQACPTGALMPASALDAEERGDRTDFDREVRSVCPYCGVGCQLSYRIRDDRIAWVEGVDGPSNQNRLCVKGRFGFDYIAHPHRLTVPLIRRDDAPPKGLNVDPSNPLTHFRPASWDEALDAAAGGLLALRRRHGGTAVSGFGSAKCSNEEAYLFQKLIRQAFGHNNLDHCTRLCHASSVAALMENVGSAAVTATFNEIENAEVAIVIGANPTENHPVAATYFKQFVRRGGKLYVMDPARYGPAPARDADAAVPPWHRRRAAERDDERHCHRGALRPAVYRRVHRGLRSLRGAPRGLRAGKRWPRSAGSRPRSIREVARTFARARAGMIFWGMGVSQHIHGTDNARCLIALALLCGQVGRPGTGLHPLRGQNNVQGASDAGLIPMVMPDYQPVGSAAVRERFRDLWRRDRHRPKSWADRGRDHRRDPGRQDQGACTSWARTLRCPTRTSSMPARRWRSSSTWWSRTSS